MENDALERRRTMVPKWRDFDSSLELYDEPSPLSSPKFVTDKWAVNSNTLYRFTNKPTRTLALELKQSAELVGDQVVLDKAKAYLENVSHPIDTGNHIPLNQNALATPIAPTPRERIQYFKKLLSLFPHDPISWINLGLNYLQLGSYDKANRCCLIACRLAPNHQYIIRSATRCFAHTGRLDLAHFIFKKCRQLPQNPWLLSAHISLGMIADTPQTHIKEARQLIASRNFSDFELNELRAALGTLEAHSGSHSTSRKLFRNALTDPTENTVSQAIKLDLQHLIPRKILVTPPPRSFEAITRLSFKNEAWDEALSASLDWLADEPYSGRPAILSSFILQIGKADHESAIKVLNAGIQANPEDIVLRNNHIFSLACSGAIDTARTQLSSLKSFASADNHPFLYATEGLVNYRAGKTESGRVLYNQAIEKFITQGNTAGARLAYLYQAAEELRAKTEGSERFANEVIDKFGKEHTSGMPLALSRLRRILKEVTNG